MLKWTLMTAVWEDGKKDRYWYGVGKGVAVTLRNGHPERKTTLFRIDFHLPELGEDAFEFDISIPFVASNRAQADGLLRTIERNFVSVVLSGRIPWHWVRESVKKTWAYR